MYIGLDIGSISVNAVVMSSGGEIREDHYQRLHGQPIETTLRVLQEIFSQTPHEKISGIAVTGTGGSLVAKLLNCFFVNEIIAQSKATTCHYPDIRSIIEIGGEDAKLILLEKDREIARKKYHLTAMEAGEIAREAGVKNMELFHFSPRYEGNSLELQKEAYEAFNNKRF